MGNYSKMQKLWLDYFKRQVETYDCPISVTLTLPESNATKVAEVVRFHSKPRPKPRSLSFTNQPIFTSPELTPPPTPTELTIRVSTPRFFSRFFSHQDPRQTVYLDITSQPVERQPAEINNLRLFLDILMSPGDGDKPLSSWRGWRWQIATWLRRRKTEAELDALPPEDTHPIPEVHAPSRLSTLDQHFLTVDAKLYRRTTVQSVLIDYIAFGEAESLELYDKVIGLFLRSCLVALTVMLATNFEAGLALNAIRTMAWSSSLSSMQIAAFALINSSLFWDIARAAF